MRKRRGAGAGLCLCPSALRGRPRPGLRGVGAHMEGGFGAALVTGLWPWTRGHGLPPGASFLGDGLGSRIFPSPSTRPAPAPRPALCPLTGGSAPCRSDQPSEEHRPPSPTRAVPQGVGAEAPGGSGEASASLQCDTPSTDGAPGVPLRDLDLSSPPVTDVTADVTEGRASSPRSPAARPARG